MIRDWMEDHLGAIVIVAFLCLVVLLGWAMEKQDKAIETKCTGIIAGSNTGRR